jgi:hypothetical protein
MPAKDDDPRLINQASYLRNAVLHWSQWRVNPEQPGWDHDHCEICWKTFTDQDWPNALHEGYTTADSYRWICADCFEDFKDRFCWLVERPA